MKCLENLSLVNDECLDDLKADIEKLVASYIDLHQICYDILDKMVEKDIGIYNATQVFKIFDKHLREIFDSSCFCGIPVWVENTEKLSRQIVNHDDGYELWEYVDIGLFLGKDLSKKIQNIKEGYWFYREGTNWEIMLESTEEVFDYLKVVIHCCNKEEIIDIARALRKYAKEHGYYE